LIQGDYGIHRVNLQGLGYTVSRTRGITNIERRESKSEKNRGTKMVAVTYHAPTSLDEAVALLSSSELPAKVLAGGTDLIIQMQKLVTEQRLIVDLKKIDGMQSATLSDEGLILGPSLCCAKLTRRDDIKALFPGLVEAAYLIGSSQVQGRASVGGNLCNASPAADTIPALIANRAVCQIVGKAGERSVPVESFVVGVGKNCLESDEILKAIVIPHPGKATSDAYLRFIPRTEMDIAVASAGASISLDSDGICTDARVAIGAVAPTALVVEEAAQKLIGQPINEATLEAVSQAASDASVPISDRRGTAEFRRHVVGVLAKRAVMAAADRAKEK
jgi:CO/xanthine dehydrogenase FAD-binding subunit